MAWIIFLCYFFTQRNFHFSFSLPFIKIDKWADAKPIIKGWGDDQIQNKQKECKNWWNSYKIGLQEMIKNQITQHIFDTYEKPRNYDFLLELTKVCEDIKKQTLNVDFSVLENRLAEYKVRQFYKKIF